MEWSRLRTGEWLAGGAGAALLFLMFLVEWFGVEGLSGGGANAWQAFSFIDLVLLLTALTGIGLAVLRGTQRRLGLPVASSVIVTLLGILAVLLILYRIIDPPEFVAEVNVPGVGPVENPSIKVGQEAGASLGLIASAALAIGGYMTMQDERTSFREARHQLIGSISSGSSGRSGGPPPAGQ